MAHPLDFEGLQADPRTVACCAMLCRCRWLGRVGCEPSRIQPYADACGVRVHRGSRCARSVFTGQLAKHPMCFTEQVCRSMGCSCVHQQTRVEVGAAAVGVARYMYGRGAPDARCAGAALALRRDGLCCCTLQQSWVLGSSRLVQWVGRMSHPGAASIHANYPQRCVSSLLRFTAAVFLLQL